MEAREAMEQHERAAQAAEGGHENASFGRRIGILVAVLAAFLAIASLSTNKAGQDTILDQARSADLFAEYQADSLKQRLGTENADSLKVLTTGTPNEAAAAPVIKSFRDDAKANKDKKDKLLPEARHFEELRDRAEVRHRNLELAEAAFQIAIVLASVAIVARVVLLAYASAGLGLLGLLMLVNGFAGMVKLP